MIPVLNKTNKKLLRLLTFKGTLATLLFTTPQVPIVGNFSGGKALAQTSICPAGTTPRTLEWNPANNRAGIESQNLSINGINATLSFTESTPGQVIDPDETLISSDTYGSLPGPNLKFNIGLPSNDPNSPYDGPAPVGSSATLTINFSQPVTLASPLTLLDVDRNGARDTANNITYVYQDRVTVNAFNGNSPAGVNLTASSPNNVRVTGNLAEGINENAFPGESFGNVTASLSGPVTRIQIVYQPGTEFGQPLQDETIGLARIQICASTGTGTIGDTVFSDVNGNNTQDQGETGIPNVTVTLTGAGPDGQLGTPDDTVQTTTTNNNGSYSFTNVSPGTYRVTIPNAPAGFTPTLTQPNPITLTANQNIDTVDFGFQQAGGSIGDTVFNDANANNTQDSGETGISNVTVTLTGAGPDGQFGTADDITRTTTTNNNGNYRFNNLPAGSYRVAVPNSPAGFNPTLNQPNPITLAANQNIDTADFGFTQQPVGSIGDTVFNDRNSNNAQDPGETGIPNVTVTLTGAGPDGQFGTSDDITRTATTDNNGNYRFTNLPSGNYRVAISNPPSGFNPTLSPPSSITLSASQNFDTADFGFRASASETNLLLVKRITNVLRNGQPLTGVNFNNFDDSPGNDDNQINQSQPVRGVRELQTPLQSGDEVEYTIYFLARGVNNVRFCDLIPDGTSYSNNSVSITGTGNGADQGTFLSPLAPLPPGNTCQSQTNSKGAVIVNLGTFNPSSRNPAFVRFRVRID
ncbi:MAG: carboxypeptidase regulatory-like domain-containing protein [Iphinoe sp. HA4291-MV1]|jgi:uncharacterized repeat protein (TIGR01451 family)|nr:carboxypeptidase regulatory-like domain-containing protein [Iphinoe sp. HA4291-MV1]